MNKTPERNRTIIAVAATAVCDHAIVLSSALFFVALLLAVLP